jgi:hypothetical protein
MKAAISVLLLVVLAVAAAMFAPLVDQFGFEQAVILIVAGAHS